VARTIHRYSKRCHQPFVVVSCGAIAPSLMESEFFGHVKGSFTGADKDRIGLFASANGGSLYLDEIHLLPLDFQSKLLRVLQDRKVKPVGSSQEINLDIRLICSSKEDLGSLVEAGKFREDLLYRIKVMDLQLPNLRERKSDIPYLIQSLIKKMARKNKKPIVSVSSSVMEKFLYYTWPGNVR
jgi:DNA-binding NtrC family response regulator